MQVWIENGLVMARIEGQEGCLTEISFLARKDQISSTILYKSSGKLTLATIQRFSWYRKPCLVVHAPGGLFDREGSAIGQFVAVYETNWREEINFTPNFSTGQYVFPARVWESTRAILMNPKGNWIDVLKAVYNSPLHSQVECPDLGVTLFVEEKHARGLTVRVDPLETGIRQAYGAELSQRIIGVRFAFDATGGWFHREVISKQVKKKRPTKTKP